MFILFSGRNISSHFDKVFSLGAGFWVSFLETLSPLIKMLIFSWAAGC
jgi:hypothetical protein